MKKAIAVPFYAALAGLVFLQISCAEAPSGQDVEGQAPAWHEGRRIEPVELGAIRNASSFGESVYFGGQLQPEDVDILRAKGIKTVVNLRRPEEMEAFPFDEKQVLEEAGITYHLIPFGHEIPPDEQSLRQIADLLDDASQHPLLLHCGSSNRVGYTWARFRALRHDLGLTGALDEGKAAGMRAPQFEAHLEEILSTASRPDGETSPEGR